MSIAVPAALQDTLQVTEQPAKGHDAPAADRNDTRKRKRTIPETDDGQDEDEHGYAHDDAGANDNGVEHVRAITPEEKRGPSAASSLSGSGNKAPKTTSAGQPRTIEQLAAAKKPVSSATMTTTIVRRAPPAATRAAPVPPSSEPEDELTRLKRELEQMAKAKADAEARLAAVTKRASGGGRGRAEEDARAVDPLPDEPWAMSAERRGALVKEAGRVLADAEEHWRELDAAQREASGAGSTNPRGDRARAKTAGIAHAGMWIRAWGFMHYHMACLYKETIAGGRAARVGRGVPTDPEELAKAEARAYAPLMVERIRMARFFHETIERFHQEFSPPTDARGRPIKPQVASMPTRHMHTVAVAHPALGAVAIGPEVAEVAALPENARTTRNLTTSKTASRRSKGSSSAISGASPSSSSSTTSSVAASPRPAKRSRTAGNASRVGAGRRRTSSRRLIDDEVDEDDDLDEDDEEDEEEDDGEDLADFIDDGDEDQEASADDDDTTLDRRSAEEGDDNDDVQKDDEEEEEDNDDEDDPKAVRKRKMASLAAKAQAARSRRH